MAIGVGQIGAGDLAAESQMIETARLGVKATDDIAKTFAISQLAETEREKLIILRESARRTLSWE